MNNIVEPGKLVKYSYVLTDDKGNVLFEAKPEAPDVMIFGESLDVLPGLVEALRGLKAGDKFGVTLPPAAAFGEAYDDNILTLDKKIFLNEEGNLPKEIQVGAMVPMLTQDGQRVMGTVKEINKDNVVMDFNHPFAGMTVEFNGKVEDVHTPTEEEKQLILGGGCHCGGCHGGGCGEGGCGEGGCGDRKDCDGSHHEGGCSCKH